VARCPFCGLTDSQFLKCRRNCKEALTYRSETAAKIANGLISQFMRDKGAYNEEEIADAAVAMTDILVERLCASTRESS
jgi:hypothetical protein